MASSLVLTLAKTESSKAPFWASVWGGFGVCGGATGSCARQRAEKAGSSPAMTRISGRTRIGSSDKTAASAYLRSDSLAKAIVASEYAMAAEREKRKSHKTMTILHPLGPAPSNHTRFQPITRP